LKIVPLLRRFQLRKPLAQLIETAGFSAISYGVNLVAGLGVSLIVAGVLAVLVATFEVDQ
jgi:hypothetical protein